ncbi:Na/Pi symporter [Salinibacillus xinjiangensis]|uniref:Na/Pi cotransporter family protein n=1 Tax=Salinibacillus xinjiangensis TaxID=1229268 RepID=A0A6G1XA90_9BACI|nr:Na/Pi symporter [Salinibacillus xinjiangensis]MRG87894.1 Na/Pi cotransporter family protein [Salinibacillus xinjiangensis]
MLQIFLFILALGVFLFGMYLVRTGLFKLSADKLKKWLAKLSDKPWKGLLLGTVVTAILQSSSAVTIMVVGLVAGRMLTFSQSIGIILGANIGTTVTTEIITLDIDALILPMAIIGAILYVFKRKNVRNTGMTLLGLSAVFGAMFGLKELAAPLAEMEYMNQLFLRLDNNLFLAVLAGTIICAILQSSTTTTAITMGFIAAGALQLDTAVAIVLGANIGTCVDAWLASIGGGREARLTAWSHIWINILGVIAFFPLIGVLADIGTLLADRPEVQVAHISVIFNVASSLIALPFVEKFSKLILKIHDRKNAQV